jgi:hypothetical protein
MQDDSSERLLPQHRVDLDDEKVQVENRTGKFSAQRNVAFAMTILSFVLVVLGGTALTAKVFAMQASERTRPVDSRTTQQDSTSMGKAPPNFTYCGPDIETAVAQNCHLDHMGGWWLPRQCYDGALLVEMDEGRDGEHNRSLPARFGIEKFEWYSDESKSTPLRTLDELKSYLMGQARKGEKMTIVTNVEHHTAHCAYASTLVGRALIRVQSGEKNQWIPEPLIRKEHAEHCELLFGAPFLGRKGGGFGEMYTKIDFELAGCERLTM